MRHTVSSRLVLLFVAVSVLTPAVQRVAAGQAAAAQTTDRFAIPATDDGLPGVGPIRRYDWFQKLWHDRRAAWAASREKDTGAVVFLGDSITQLWEGGLPAAFPGMKMANRGISGDTTRGVLIRLQEDVLVLNPVAIVLLIGTNDLDEAATPEMIASNVKLILAAIKAHDPKTPVVLCQVMPSSPSKNRPAEKIKKVNELYLAAVKNDPQIIPLDTWRLFADANGDAPIGEFPDLLHPNDMRLQEMGGRAEPRIRDAAADGDHARRLRARRGVHTALQRHGPDRLGLSPDDRRPTGRTRRSGRPRTRMRPRGRSSIRRPRSTG